MYRVEPLPLVNIFTTFVLSWIELTRERLHSVVSELVQSAKVRCDALRMRLR